MKEERETPEMQEIRKILEALKDTDVEEFAWEAEGTRLAIGREPSAPRPEPAAAAEEKPAEDKTLYIRSPVVGIFHRKQNPEDPPFVNEGSPVSPGQKVGVVESMRILNDVVSEHAGRIARLLVGDGKPVEYGQPLMEVEPEENV